MSLVRAENIYKSYAGVSVLRGTSIRVEKGEKIGLIGLNGCGKSTLLRVIAGDTQSDEGVLERMKRCSVTSLAQIPHVEGDTHLIDVVLDHFRELTEMEEDLKRLETRLPGADQKTIEAYSRAEEEFRFRGGYRYRADARRVMTGLGFSEKEFHQTFETLSGGQRTRLMLALALLGDADLLLLDEPENHLDLQAREWLETFLKEWPAAFIIVSHDRRLLNAAARRIVEIRDGHAKSYSGNYDDYLREKEAIFERERSKFKRQKEFIEREEAWINRFRYKNTKSRQVQSRIKRLQKMDRVKAPHEDSSATRFRHGEVVRSGQSVVEARDLTMRYGDLLLYENLSFHVGRGERVGIIGPNGSGKTTLLRQLAGRLDGGEGLVTLGHKVSVGIFDQHQDDLQESNDLLAEIRVVRPQMLDREARSYLGRFLFSGDDVFKSVGDLSGGERTRLALAKLILGETNLLLLDEPTNHLDIASRESLEQSLDEYTGSIVIVSHDRALIDGLVDKLIVIDRESAFVFLGNYSHYKWKMRQELTEDIDASNKDAMKIRNPAGVQREIRKATQRESRMRRKRHSELEISIADTEKYIAEHEARFAKTDPSEHELLKDLKEEYESLRRNLDAMYLEWGELGDAFSSESESPN